jgi:hypothetical protein
VRRTLPLGNSQKKEEISNPTIRNFTKLKSSNPTIRRAFFGSG